MDFSIPDRVRQIAGTLRPFVEEELVPLEPRLFAEGFGALAAVWLFISILLFDMSSAAAWNTAIAAIVTFVLSVWDGAEISQMQHGGRLQKT